MVVPPRAPVMDIVMRRTHVLMFVLLPLWAMMLILRSQGGQNSDGLLETMISTQKLTVFFWDQDRFANLLPLVTAFLRDPGANAWAQLFLRALLGLVAPLLVTSLMLPDLRAAWGATVLTGAVLTWTLPHMLRFETYLEASPYGTSFALAGAAMTMLRRSALMEGGQRRLANVIALALLIGAFLVNVALAFVVFPLVLLILATRPVPTVLKFGLLCACALGTAWLAGKVFAHGTATSRRFEAGIAGIRHLGEWLLVPAFRNCFIVTLVVATASIVVARVTSPANSARQSMAVLRPPLVAALLYLAVIMTSHHVALNQYHPRYLVPCYILAASACGIAFIQLSEAAPFPRARRYLPLVAGMASLAALASEGAPSRTGIVDARWSDLASEIGHIVIRRSLDAVAGDYWDVWPSVFDAEDSRYHLGQGDDGVYGISDRGDVRRTEFIALLHARRILRIGCIDMSAFRCSRSVAVSMELPDAVVSSDGPAIRLRNGRNLLVGSLSLSDDYAP